MGSVAFSAVTRITVRSDRRASTETERHSGSERGVTLHDFLSGIVQREALPAVRPPHHQYCG
jgi:hypothetical protein